MRAIQAEKLSFSCEFRWESSNETNIDNFQTQCHQMYGYIWDFSNNLKKLKMWHFFDEIFTVTRYWKWKPLSFISLSLCLSSFETFEDFWEKRNLEGWWSLQVQKKILLFQMDKVIGILIDCPVYFEYILWTLWTLMSAH